MAAFGGSWISYHARVSPDKLALHDLGKGHRLSYAELDERIGCVAGLLRHSFGVGRGDRVVMLSRGCFRAFEVMYACARLGAIFVPLNIRLSDAELGVLAGDAEPVVMVGEGDLVSAASRPGYRRCPGKTATSRRWRAARPSTRSWRTATTRG